MKVINSKLAAIGMAAFVFASCSDSSTPENGGKTPEINVSEAVTASLTSTSAAELAERVSNYKIPTANARFFSPTRATVTRAFTTKVPEIPDEPNKIITLNNPTDLVEGKTYNVKGKGKVLDLSGKKIKGVTIFIHGGATLKMDATQGGNTIYVQEAGTLQFTGTGDMIAANDKVICNDGFILSDHDISIAGKLYASFYGKEKDGKTENLNYGLGKVDIKNKEDKKKATITPLQNITFKNGADAYFYGSIRAINLNIEQGATVNTATHVMNATTVNVNGNLQVGGFLRTETLNVTGNLVGTPESAIKASKDLVVEPGATITADYINVTNNPKNADGTQKRDENNKTIPGEATLTLKGACKIKINNKSIINVNNLVTDNASAGQITLEDKNAFAVIKADKFKNNGPEEIVALATSGTNATFLLQFTESYNGSTKLNSFEDLDLAASYLDYDKATEGGIGVTEKGDEDNDTDFKSYGYEWTGDVTQIANKPKLDLIAAAEPVNDNLSASCIQLGTGNKIYVTYHTNGALKNMKGNIEVAHMAGNKLEIDQSVATKDQNANYNHLLLDGSNLWVAGSSKYTFIGKLGLNEDGSIGADNGLELYPIDRDFEDDPETPNDKGNDANSIAKYKGQYYVATKNGFTVFDTDMNYWTLVDKYIAKYTLAANDKLYTLDEHGRLNVYTQGNFENGTTYNVGEASPSNTKSMIAVDGSTIYVTRGSNGLARIDANGNIKKTFFECPTNKKGEAKGYCNGVAVDNKYIYVACGSYGLVVLNKEDGKEICHRQAHTGKSANFVTVDEAGNIYVAYGKSRVQVFKVATTTK